MDKRLRTQENITRQWKSTSFPVLQYDGYIYLLWVLTGSLNSLGGTGPIFGYR